MPRLSVWLCIACLTPPALAQKRPQPATSQDQTVLRVTTHLIQVNVIVKDKRGNPVSDLKRGDFVVFDEGQEQTISLFSTESNHPLASPPEPLPANTFSNRLEYHAGTPTSVTAMLLDGLNTHILDQAHARAQVIKFLQQLQPQDRVALYALGANLRVLQDFTGDAGTLLKALARYKGHTSADLDASELDRNQPALTVTGGPRTGLEQFNAWLDEANQRMADFFIEKRVAITVDALEAISDHLAQLPGRKNLIWVSGSFPYMVGLDQLPTPENTGRFQRNFSPEIARAARVLNSDNLAIYPVDARGLMVERMFEAEHRFTRAQLTRAFIPMDFSLGTMQELADRTGGRAFFNSNDIQGSIRRAIDDSQFIYVLGYYPTHGKWDGKFRKIKVGVKRPGTQARYRRGYFAVPEEAPDSRKQEANMAQAVWNPLDATGVRLIVHVDPQSTGEMKLECYVDPHDITLRPEKDRWVGELDVILVQLGADGGSLGGITQTIQMDLKRETYERVLREGAKLSETLAQVPEATEVRMVVRDAPSGTLGSISIPLRQVRKAGSS